MRKLITAGLAALLTLAGTVYAFPPNTNSATITINSSAGHKYRDFDFDIAAYSDQVFVFTFDKSIATLSTTFKVFRHTNTGRVTYVSITDITESGTTATWSVARTNWPAVRSDYLAELWAYNAASNAVGPLARGRINITYSANYGDDTFDFPDYDEDIYEAALGDLNLAGDVTGAITNNVVTAIRGVSVTNDASPTDNYILKYDSALGRWNYEVEAGGYSTISDSAYSDSWNTDTNAATKNVLFDYLVIHDTDSDGVWTDESWYTLLLARAGGTMTGDLDIDDNYLYFGSDNDKVIWDNGSVLTMQTSTGTVAIGVGGVSYVWSTTGLDMKSQNITNIASDAYDSAWNGNSSAAAKNDIYDEMETMVEDGDTLSTGLYGPSATATNQYITRQDVLNLTAHNITMYLRQAETSTVVSGYYLMDVLPGDAAQTNITHSTVTNNQYLSAFVTSNAMGLTSMEAGTWNVHAHMYLDGVPSDACTVKAEAYLLNAGGSEYYEVDETPAETITDTLTGHDFQITLSTGITFAATDKWVVKFKVVSQTGEPDVIISTDGGVDGYLQGSVGSFAEIDPLAVLADGSRAMSGNLNMGGNSVTNADDVSISGDLSLVDNGKVKLGTGGDASIVWDGTDTRIASENVTAGDGLYFDEFDRYTFNAVNTNGACFVLDCPDTMAANALAFSIDRGGSIFTVDEDGDVLVASTIQSKAGGGAWAKLDTKVTVNSTAPEVEWSDSSVGGGDWTWKADADDFFATVDSDATLNGEALRIKGDTGYVGILTNAPATTLDVNGDTTIRGELTVEDVTLSGTLTATQATVNVSNVTAQVGSYSTSLTVGGVPVVPAPQIFIVATNRTWTATEFQNAIIYVTGVCTQTLPAVNDDCFGTIVADGANVIYVDPNASDLIRLDGLAKSDGELIYSDGDSGDMAVITYRDTNGWFAATDGGWTEETP